MVVLWFTVMRLVSNATNSVETRISETLAMKGLLLSSLGKKAEAYSAVDKGLRKNLASIVCIL